MKYICFICLCIMAFPVMANDKIIRIYQDADLSNHRKSSESIQKGIELAFSEIGNSISGYSVEFKYLNHRGNVVRSKMNYEKFINDPKALAIFSGIHSPPLIKNRDFINKSKALTLVPWAAGAPISRYPSSENWIFRLSLDDARAAPVLVDFAMKNKKCKSPHLLLENTPWGDSNLTGISNSLIKYGIVNATATRFGWNMGEQSSRMILREILENGHDCILLVANSVEGAIIIQSLLDIDAEDKLKIISHWGITGGNFHEIINATKRTNIDLSFIQSCFAFTNSVQSDFAKDVFSRLKKKYRSEINIPEDLHSAVGFIHAYDLTRVLIAAIKQTGLTGDIKIDRNAIRLALENLQSEVQGLVKTYKKPFAQFDAKNNVNAHEALNSNDFCMARFGYADEILILGDE